MLSIKGKNNMEKMKFNVFVYIFKMLVCSCIWFIIACWTADNMANFSNELIIIKFNPDAIFQFRLGDIIAILIAVISQYFLLVKGGVYFYTFKTDCKNPIFCLFLNILFGGFICLNCAEYTVIKNFDAMFIAKAFVIMAIVNYFLFYARYGYEFREQSFIEDWTKTVYKPMDFLNKDK